MNASIGILALLSISTSALALSDAACKPHEMSDNGYAVYLSQNQNGYTGDLQEQKIYGSFSMFNGDVKFEVTKENGACKILVTNPIARCGDDRCLNPYRFELQIEENVGTKLLSVGGKKISDPGSTMDCEFSARFINDLDALCSAI